MYNVSVIGCGYMGRGHLEDIYLRDNIRVSAVCDLDPAKAGAAAKQFNAGGFFTDYRRMLDEAETDIVIAATYPSSHLDILKQCIRRGKHLICEKPITPTLEQGREFVRLVKENPQIKVLVGHILRHNTTYAQVARLIRSGAIGSPVIMRMTQNHRTPNWEKYLALIQETSPIIDCGVHYVDVMRWFTGADVAHVSGVGAKTESTVPEGKYNYGIMHVKLSDGSAGTYEVGWGHTIRTDNSKEFTGPLGSIKITYQKDRTTHRESGNLIEIFRYPENETEMINIPYVNKPTGEQLAHLIRMIEEGVPAKPSIDDVYESFRTVCEADRRIRETL